MLQLTDVGVGAAAIFAWRCGFNWSAIEEAMVQGVTRAIPAIMIFLLISILIAVWIAAGVVPTMLYYGIQALSADIFLPATLIICAVASVATGTSWGTSGTIGVALICIGSSLGFPLPIVAGAVISGAYFGNKMSPLSDTTNLASSMAGTDLYTHIRHMAKTTSIAFGITLIIEIVIGYQYSSNIEELTDIAIILTALEQNFTLHPILLLPPAVLIDISYKKVPPLPGIALGILLAAILGMIMQGVSIIEIMRVSFYGFFQTAALTQLMTFCPGVA